MKIKRVKLKELTVNITDGEHGSVIDDINGIYYLLSNKNIINGKIIFDSEDRRITEASFKKINQRTKLNYGDVVLSTVGTIGKVAIIKDERLTYDFQRSVGIIKCDTKKLTPQYLFYYLNLETVQKRLKTLSKGAVQKCLFISDLEAIDIDIPVNFQDQLRITKALELIDKKIELNIRINDELQEMAKTIYQYSFFNSENEYQFEEK